MVVGLKLFFAHLNLRWGIEMGLIFLLSVTMGGFGDF